MWRESYLFHIGYSTVNFNYEVYQSIETKYIKVKDIGTEKEF